MESDKGAAFRGDLGTEYTDLFDDCVVPWDPGTMLLVVEWLSHPGECRCVRGARMA